MFATMSRAEILAKKNLVGAKNCSQRNFQDFRYYCDYEPAGRMGVADMDPNSLRSQSRRET